MYFEIPYNDKGLAPQFAGIWIPKRGWNYASKSYIFPDKFYRLSNGPELLLAYVEWPSTRKVELDDPGAPGGKRIKRLDVEVSFLETIAKKMNFT
ncbi:hypothetical protein Pmani_017637 [Petrolisthes manimaculis]|uniref:Uncharacterized protein n=1 Tax=Petrolisthes manimaculis TaxID=1843537 RepID=A0AAE1PM71_9EUCA|nr:hypothetical protein Pmani_017637 [Petrolisthes manimaculis]